MKPPYFAVIFTSTLSSEAQGYGDVAARMVEMAQGQRGFLGIDSARGEDRHGITVSYWDSLEAIREWKAEVEHREAQKLGRDRFYERYHVRIARVEREYSFE